MQIKTLELSLSVEDNHVSVIACQPRRFVEDTSRLVRFVEDTSSLVRCTPRRVDFQNQIY